MFEQKHGSTSIQETFVIEVLVGILFILMCYTKSMRVKRCIRRRWVGPRAMEVNACLNAYVDIQEIISVQCIFSSVFSRGKSWKDSPSPRAAIEIMPFFVLPRHRSPAVERELERGILRAQLVIL